MCIQKNFVVYRNVGVQRKSFLIDGDGCIVFANIKNETKRKRKKDLEEDKLTRKLVRVSKLTREFDNHVCRHQNCILYVVKYFFFTIFCYEVLLQV